VIRVTDGTLTIPNVISELEWLIPGKWKWNVESGGNSNTFKTLFPSKTKLKRMAEWGVVQTKFNNAKLKIEERPLGDKAKFALPKIWVQFTGLPNDLHDFLTIWAIGSILGVTKAVDMRFTRQHAVCRLQVLVLDPNLIPQFVDIVIGDYLYELQFMVEINGDANNPEPMDMDHHGKEDGDNNKGTRENNKAPGTQQGAANGKEAKESRNKSDAPVLPGGNSNIATHRRNSLLSKGAAIRITAPAEQNKHPIYRIQDPGSDGLLVANSGTSTTVDEALGDNIAAVTNAEANGKELLQEGGV